MRIVFTYTNSQLDSLAASLKYSGFDVRFWLNQRKPTFDMFAEVKPDLVITVPHYIDNAMMECLDEYKDTKLVSLGNDTSNKYLDKALICLLTPLKSKIKLPDNFLKVEQFADIFTYYTGKHSLKTKSEIVCIDVMQQEIDAIAAAGLQVKAFGNKVDTPYFLGSIDAAKTREVLASGRIAIGPNCYNLIAGGCFSLSNIEHEVIPYYTSTEELVEQCKKYVPYKPARATRHTIFKECFDYVYNRHTCFHRMADILNMLHMNNEVEQVLGGLKKYAKQRFG